MPSGSPACQRKPTLLTSRPHDWQAAGSPKLSEHYAHEVGGIVKPSEQFLLEDPTPMANHGLPELKGGSPQALELPVASRRHAVEAPTPAASHRTLVTTKSMELFLEPTPSGNQSHRHSANQSHRHSGDAGVVACVGQQNNLTAKTCDIAFLASKLAGRWMLQTGGVVAASAKEASSSAMVKLAEATRQVDSTISDYVQQAWENFHNGDSSDSESEGSEESEGAGAEKETLPAAAPTWAQQPACLAAPPQPALVAAGQLQAQQQLAWELQRLSGLGVQPQAAVPSLMVPAGLQWAGQPVAPAAAQLPGLAAHAAGASFPRAQTFDPASTVYRIQAPPRAPTFGQVNADGRFWYPTVHSTSFAYSQR
mmetsp:Transcript_95075/g.295695  ORF Transcript_95075/g.295695 Transcript_95075/m.295695 type:complete len:366 (+) Transcript_95075:192-1289(+)